MYAEVSFTQGRRRRRAAAAASSQAAAKKAATGSSGLGAIAEEQDAAPSRRKTIMTPRRRGRSGAASAPASSSPQPLLAAAAEPEEVTLGGRGRKQAAGELRKAQAEAARLRVDNEALQQRCEAHVAQIAGLRAELAAAAGASSSGAAKENAAPLPRQRPAMPSAGALQSALQSRGSKKRATPAKSPRPASSALNSSLNSSLNGEDMLAALRTGRGRLKGSTRTLTAATVADSPRIAPGLPETSSHDDFLAKAMASRRARTRDSDEDESGWSPASSAASCSPR